MLGNILGGKITFLKQSTVREIMIDLIIKNKGLTISQLQEKTKDSKGLTYNYRTIWQHVKSLEQSGMVKLEKEEHSPGKPVSVIISKQLEELIEFDKKFKQSKRS